MSSRNTEEPSPEATQAPKRQRGRRVIHRSLEERKQKNRESQASFKIRWQAYVKDLEASKEDVLERIRDLQQTHAATREECLLLQYKNSSLKRILFKKGKERKQATQALLIRVLGIDAQAELRRYRPLQSGSGLAVLTSGPTSQQQTRSSFELDTSDGDRNAVDPRPNQVPSLYQARLDQLEKGYEGDPYIAVTSDEDLSHQVVGTGPYPERFHETPVFQGHAPVVGSGAEASMQPLAMGQPGNSRAPHLNTASETFNPYHPSPDDLFGFTASTRAVYQAGTLRGYQWTGMSPFRRLL